MPKEGEMTLLRVKESHVQFDKHGVPNVVNAGQLVDSDSALVKGREHLFETADTAIRLDQPAAHHAAPVNVETADVTPGGKRTRTEPVSRRSRGKSAEQAEENGDTETGVIEPPSADGTETE